jgi:hypothetical protein
MNCDTVILITKNNIRTKRVSPASMGVKKSGLEPSTFVGPGLCVFPYSNSSIDSQTSYYNAARLRWNCIERKRGEIEDQLIDDLVEWSMWHYAVVRE